MRFAALAALLLAITALAGCAQPEATTDSIDATSSGQAVDSDPANEPPQATLQASSSSGAPPMEVVFSLGARDSEGDAMTWTLDFGDGTDKARGDKLPVAIEHAYTRTGAFPVVFSVSDGSEASEASLSIRVAAGQSAQGPPTTASSPPPPQPQPASPPPSSTTTTTTSASSTTAASTSTTTTTSSSSSSTSSEETTSSTTTTTSDSSTTTSESTTTTTSSSTSTTSSEETSTTTTSSDPTTSSTTTTTQEPPPDEGNNTGDPPE